jgi:hypothetical protein
MTLSDWAQLSEVVAAVAVVVSLVYVGVGLRENTAAVRSAARQAVTSSSQDSLLAQASDPGLSHVRRVGDEVYASLSEDEKHQYVTL